MNPLALFVWDWCGYPMDELVVLVKGFLNNELVVKMNPPLNRTTYSKDEWSNWLLSPTVKREMDELEWSKPDGGLNLVTLFNNGEGNLDNDDLIQTWLLQQWWKEPWWMNLVLGLGEEWFSKNTALGSITWNKAAKHSGARSLWDLGRALLMKWMWKRIS